MVTTTTSSSSSICSSGACTAEGAALVAAEAQAHASSCVIGIFRKRGHGSLTMKGQRKAGVPGMHADWGHVSPPSGTVTAVLAGGGHGSAGRPSAQAACRPFSTDSGVTLPNFKVVNGRPLVAAMPIHCPRSQRRQLMPGRGGRRRKCALPLAAVLFATQSIAGSSQIAAGEALSQ